jgi:hypothetical protein
VLCLCSFCVVCPLFPVSLDCSLLIVLSFFLAFIYQSVCSMLCKSIYLNCFIPFLYSILFLVTIPTNGASFVDGRTNQLHDYKVLTNNVLIFFYRVYGTS